MRNQVSPYHAVRQHRHQRVYHDRADCPIGREIHSQELAAGTGGFPRCEQCQAMQVDEALPDAQAFTT
jgi:hypothetical protein